MVYARGRCANFDLTNYPVTDGTLRSVGIVCRGGVRLKALSTG